VERRKTGKGAMRIKLHSKKTERKTNNSRKMCVNNWVSTLRRRDEMTAAD
jgi:hypothetical protein